MAPIIFPFFDWDGNGTTGDLFDCAAEQKIYESIHNNNEESDFLDELIPAVLPSGASSYNDANDFSTEDNIEIEDFCIQDNTETDDSENTDEKYLLTERDINKIMWIAACSIFKEYVGIDFDGETDPKKIEEILNNYKDGWRYHCESGTQYFLYPDSYKTEAEYIAVLDYAKRIKQRYEKRMDELKKEYYIDEKCEEKKTYTYCGVVFEGNSMIYHYLADNNEDIKPDDIVIVPVGSDNVENEATVVSVGNYLSNAVPYPVEKTKKIISKK